MAKRIDKNAQRIKDIFDLANSATRTNWEHVNQDGSIYGGPNNQGGFNNQPGRFSPGYSGKGLRPTGLPNAPGLRKPGSGGSRVMNTPTAGGFRNRFPKKPPNQPGSPNFLRPNNIYEEGY